MTEATRLKKFIADQEEAVQLARETADSSDSIRIDAINVALSLAHCNVEPGTFVSVKSLIADAKQVEAYLRSPS